ncbi:hypothetical protein JWG42_17020 [Desulfoprunum benzoelyticum]|uniref:Uncharacterized protein n=1 Tax=Desulfoprunum benzoelyticum TaxID=1506996 RepID=A0A840UU75_9BACT|nr:hypothetical protein [Desulfoprunum benzoelyticum]MBB5349747.1 hypothetical protein [Desulfoprunum benzoelyticum]MBM9531863.1 hypothetical protein [Desulfoprunum benzoelyticum]
MDDIFQFPHIAGPFMAQQAVDDRLGEKIDILLECLAISSDEMGDEIDNVLFPLAQRWN